LTKTELEIFIWEVKASFPKVEAIHFSREYWDMLEWEDGLDFNVPKNVAGVLTFTHLNGNLTDRANFVPDPTEFWEEVEVYVTDWLYND
jgi:hypothetical protein